MGVAHLTGEINPRLKLKRGAMKYISVRITIGFIASLMLAGFGCSAVVYEYVSNPLIKRVETQIFSASFTPAKDDAGYFSSFILEVENKLDTNIEIDWNKTRYIHDEKHSS